MRCIECGAEEVSERPERTARGYRRFRCRVCGKQFNERGGGILNRAQYPSDVIALVVFWRLRYKLSLRDLTEMFLMPWHDIWGSVQRIGAVKAVVPAAELITRLRAEYAEASARISQMITPRVTRWLGGAAATGSNKGL